MSSSGAVRLGEIAGRLPMPFAALSIRSTSVLRRLRCSGRLRAVVNLAGGCAQHDTTWEFPVADPLASATERKVQELARPFWSRARSKTSQMDPRLSL